MGSTMEIRGGGTHQYEEKKEEKFTENGTTQTDPTRIQFRRSGIKDRKQDEGEGSRYQELRKKEGKKQKWAREREISRRMSGCFSFKTAA